MSDCGFRRCWIVCRTCLFQVVFVVYLLLNAYSVWFGFSLRVS